MKGDLDRKEELNGDHLVPLTSQAIAVLKALWHLPARANFSFPAIGIPTVR